MTVGIVQTSYQLVERLEIRGHAYYRTDTSNLGEAITSLGVLYRALIDILPCVGTLLLELPCVGTLLLEDGLFIDETWSYISSLKQLHDLTVSGCSFHPSNSQSVITMEYLSYAKWSVLPDSVVILSKIMAPSLRTFQVDVTAKEWISVDANAMNYNITESAFPNLASLAVTFATSLPWNVGVYKNLRELKLRPKYFYLTDLMTRSDILEAILMKPGDFRALETIELSGLLSECDILLLMLERKNIYEPPGISPIKTIVVHSPLPYRLLYPITTLLRGKFPDRGPNVSFSLDAVGQRMLDEFS
ncbi:hypothetical protein M408DRAFT_27812 [Serendipita vermifera MAFF 305830]|uniref:F-box domain-containing protein n=1 Tax=Serendipita vermifera MAFF 305830 TaxID=933852 RepID=A0A0C3AFM8_SERVB|nr:hypothetical protein M408DRAFT_27812 [Serendipita vermifera MAFF 305830]